MSVVNFKSRIHFQESWTNKIKAFFVAATWFKENKSDLCVSTKPCSIIRVRACPFDKWGSKLLQPWNLFFFKVEAIGFSVFSLSSYNPPTKITCLHAWVSMFVFVCLVCACVCVSACGLLKPSRSQQHYVNTERNRKNGEGGCGNMRQIYQQSMSPLYDLHFIHQNHLSTLFRCISICISFLNAAWTLTLIIARCAKDFAQQERKLCGKDSVSIGHLTAATIRPSLCLGSRAHI